MYSNSIGLFICITLFCLHIYFLTWSNKPRIEILRYIIIFLPAYFALSIFITSLCVEFINDIPFTFCEFFGDMANFEFFMWFAFAIYIFIPALLILIICYTTIAIYKYFKNQVSYRIYRKEAAIMLIIVICHILFYVL